MRIVKVYFGLHSAAHRAAVREPTPKARRVTIKDISLKPSGSHPAADVEDWMVGVSFEQTRFNLT